MLSWMNPYIGVRVYSRAIYDGMVTLTSDKNTERYPANFAKFAPAQNKRFAKNLFRNR